MMPLDKFAEKHGFTTATVRAWVVRHGLPCIKIGRRVYLTDSDFEKWLASRKVSVGEVASVAPTMEFSVAGKVSRVAGKVHKVF